MNKTPLKIIAILISALLVAAISFQLTKKLNNQTFSAGAPINYPFVQNLFGNTVEPSPTQQLPLVDRSQIFADKPLTNSECADCVTLLMTGDVLPARTVNQKTTSLNDFTWPFAKTADFLKSADITVINLETPLINDCPIKTDGMVFCGNQKNVDGLKYAGIDIVNLANNHAGNEGKQGVIGTNQLLTQQGFLTTGVQQPVYKTVKGIKFAFL